MAINIEELIKKRIEIKNSLKKHIKIEIKEFKELELGDGVAEFRPLSVIEWEELQKKEIDADKELIYNTCVSPNLKDDRLLKAFNCSLEDGREPVEIVDELLSPGTQASICEVIILKSKLYKEDGMSKLVEDEIKN